MRLTWIALLAVLSSTAQAATFVVDNTQPGATVFTQACTAAPNDCSWRGALLLADANTDLDTIAFNIPAASDSGCNATTGICVLPSPGNFFTTLPSGVNAVGPISNLIIDGYTQPGAAPNTLSADGGGFNAQIKIELTGQISFTGNTTVRGVALSEMPDFSQRSVLSFGSHDDTGNGTLQGSIIGAHADGSPLNQISNPPTQVRLAGCNIFGGDPLAINYQYQVGGLSPAERNWFALTGVYFQTCATIFISTASVSAQFQGNLFGTTMAGLPNAYVSTQWIYYFNSASTPSNIVIGGTIANARNVFANGNITSATPIDASTTQALTIQGNYFGFGVDGVTAGLNLETSGVIDVARARIGGFNPGEANLIAIDSLNSNGNTAILDRGQNSIGLNVYRNISTTLHDSGLTSVIRQSPLLSYSINDAGDADGEMTGQRLQNFPEISAYSIVGNMLSITYKVDSATSNAEYPLTLSFYAAPDARSVTPQTYLGSDSYTAAEATANKTIQIPLPNGHGLTNSSVIIGHADQATFKGTSAMSWYPTVVTFVGNQGGFRNQPVNIQVNLPGLVAAPRGRVRIYDSVQTPVNECFTTLSASVANPLIATGTCALTFTDSSTHTIKARYLDASESFHAINNAEATRTVVITEPPADGLFCHGFEDGQTGVCP